MAEVSYHGMNSEEVIIGAPSNENMWRGLKTWILQPKRLVLVSAVALIAVACTLTLCLTFQNVKADMPHVTAVDCHETQKPKLLKYLTGLDKTISGVDLRSFKHTELQNIMRITKQLPGVLSTKIPEPTANNSEWTSFVESAISVWKRHHLVQILWVINYTYIYDNIFDSSGNVGKETDWNELTLEGSFANTKWKQQLDYIGPHLQKLQCAGVVPILDILPVINHKHKQIWGWSGRPGVNGSSKLYRMTQDYLKQTYSLTSIIWTWSFTKYSFTQFEEYWPGSEYVDVVSVYMLTKKELTINDYQRLLNLVGDTPMSMKWMYYVPTTQILATQPRWTWFSALEFSIGDSNYRSMNDIQATFNSPSVINGGNIMYFSNTN